MGWESIIPDMDIVRLIMVIVLTAAVIFYFYRRSKKLKEMEAEERLRDVYR